jgi:hypothetical protein
MDIDKVANTIDYNTSIIDLNKESKTLQNLIKLKREDLVLLVKNLENKFSESELNFNYLKNNYQVTFSYYSENDEHFFDLIYNYHSDFEEGDFQINTISLLNVDNLNSYYKTLNNIKNTLSNKDELLKFLKSFILNYRNILNNINYIHDKIKSTQLAINLSKNKNKFELNKFEKIFVINKNINLDFVLDEDVFHKIDHKNALIFIFYTYKFSNNDIIFFKHRIEVIQDSDNNYTYSENNKPISLDYLNNLLSYCFSYQGKLILEPIQIRDLDPLLFTNAYDRNILKAPYHSLIKALKIDFVKLNIKEF